MKKASALLMFFCIICLLLVGCTATPDEKTDAALDGILTNLDLISEQLDSIAATKAAAAERESSKPVIVKPQVSGNTEAENAFVIWVSDPDFPALVQDIATQYIGAEAAERLCFVILEDDTDYQNELDEALCDPDDPLYPDLLLLESGYAQKYVLSGYLLSGSELSLSSDNYAGMYPYTVTLGSGIDGGMYVFFWRAEPGCWLLRRDLAKEYLGSTDPDELQSMLSTWGRVVSVSKDVYEQSGGKVRLLSGADDLKYVFTNGGRSQSWYDENNIITIDHAISDYFSVAGDLAGLSFDARMGSDEWTALKSGDGTSENAAIAYTGCPWYMQELLPENWDNNCILIQGPGCFYWGAQGLAASEHCADVSLAHEIICRLCCNADSMTYLCQNYGAFVNNSTAIENTIAAANDSENEFTLSKTELDNLSFFAARSAGLVTRAVSEESVISGELLSDVLADYLESGDRDAALADLAAAIHHRYSYLFTE